MGQALYRKYRSRSLEEIVGQAHITDTLGRALKSGRISHAYLFTGPRGVGKTSVARVLAHELNDIPYEHEDNHLDIIEIDAASSGGVDEVRELREKVYVAPTRGKFKVYIIDEVHMMTTPAFNALLKTLEEPPAHVVFILATTEAHKLPATIVSRTQRFTFKPVALPEVIQHLRSIANKENIVITDEALNFIAEHSEGSFRDSISMLDQASSLHKQIKLSDLELLFGVPPVAAIEGITQSLEQHESQAVVVQLASLRSDGYQASAVAKQLGRHLRAVLLDNTGPLPPEKLLHLIGRLIDVPASANPDQLLELILLESALENHPTIRRANIRSATTQFPTRSAPPPSTNSATAKSTKAKPRSNDKSAVHTTEHMLSESQWNAVLESLKQQYNTLYGIMKTATPIFLPGKIQLTFRYAFHQKRANDVKNKKILSMVLENVTGNSLRIDCLLSSIETPKAMLSGAETISYRTPAAVSVMSLDTISNIFGGGELLES